LSEPLDLLKAALAHRYTIVREVGSGGMATVYLAEDLRHRRKVALKVLRPELAATIGSVRFLHEIEVAAGLQHPHILPLLDSGDADGFLYYAMPFIEGPSLRDRLARQGELPIPDALKILIEVVDALAAAHEKGIVHRDIKPENILLTGRHALVADFGIAKAIGAMTGQHTLTTTGVALGTPAYMAPEQASAEPQIDHRADLYAVGVMAYEMLTGQPPFAGASSAQVLTAHLTQAPEPVTRRRASVSPALEQVVMRCLEKRPADRYQSAEELVTALESLFTPTGGVTPVHTQPVTGVRRTLAWSRRMLVIGGVAAVTLVVLVAALLRRKTEWRIEFGPVRPVTADAGLEIQPALSPDGKTLAYVSGPRGQLKVYVRSLGGGTPIEVVKDFERQQQRPRWSPDGTRLLFDVADTVYVVPSLGGTPRLAVSGGRNAAWSPDGRTIAYTGRVTAAEPGLWVRDVDGGAPRALATGSSHSPAWSPDGQLIAFVSENPEWQTFGSGNLGPSVLMVVRTDGGEPVRLTGRKFMNMSPQWLPDSRHLLFMSSQDGGRDLYSLAVDGSGRTQGPPVRLTTGLDIGTFSLSADGTQLAYNSFPNTSNIWAIPIPASGILTEAVATPITTGTNHVEGLAVSRDGQWLALSSDRLGNTDIYVMPIAGGEPRQVTTDPSYEFAPGWSADGRQIVFHSWRNETRDLFVISASGADETLVAGGLGMEYYGDWAPDGRSIVFRRDLELHVVSQGAAGRWGEPRRLTTGRGAHVHWSPDGRWILYEGRLNVIPPEGGTPRPLLTTENWSPADGSVSYAVWAPDSRTIYFRTFNPTESVDTFWAIPAAGGYPKALVRFTNLAFADPSFATDGKRFYFTVADYRGDLKVMDVRRAR
jgi:serine/threonine-protein kinase